MPKPSTCERPWQHLYPPHAAPTFISRHQDVLSQFRVQLERCPDATALWHLDLEYSYRDLDQKSSAVAKWMSARGVGLGDRVAILHQNSPEFVIIVLAAWKIGSVPTPCNPAYRSAELSRIFVDCAPKAVFCEHGSCSDTRVALEAVGLSAVPTIASIPDNSLGKRTSAVFQLPEEAIPLREVLVGKECTPEASLTPDGESMGLLLYTSGTTGTPKGTMLKHAGLAFNAEALTRWCELGERSRILAIAPFFHVTGFVCHIAAAFASGAMLIAHYRFDPTLVLDVIRRTKPSFTIGAITAFNALLNEPSAVRSDMESFDKIYSGGASIPPALAEAFRVKFGHTIRTAYGMTETAAPTHLAPPSGPIPIDPQSGALAIGVPIPCTDAVCVDEEGRVLPPGQIGELLLCGPQIMAGYLNKAEESAEALKGGWMHSGDIAFQDEFGWFYLVDRKKDVIIASGFKVWPREVEDVLYTHPAIREAAVVGIPDDYRGENVKAFVSLRHGSVVDPRSLAAHCRERLASYKVPRVFEILDDLPKTVSGKIQRVVLRKRVAGP